MKWRALSLTGEMVNLVRPAKAERRRRARKEPVWVVSFLVVCLEIV